MKDLAKPNRRSQRPVRRTEWNLGVSMGVFLHSLQGKLFDSIEIRDLVGPSSATTYNPRGRACQSEPG